MAARHRSRLRALQVLFNWDMRKGLLDTAIAQYYDTLHSEDPEAEVQLKPDRFMEELVRGTVESMPQIDKQIEATASNWRIERMPVVDRNIIRLAIYEMRLGTLPAPVIIDEALDLAQQFSGDDSMAFINGVLDAINKNAAKAKSQM